LAETSEQIAICPNRDCKSPIPSSHPYTWCSECGERLPDDIQARLPCVQDVRRKAAAARSSLRSQSKGTESIEIHGRPLRCVICRHDRFHRQAKDVGTLAAEFFGFEANEYFVCGECGYVHWFRTS
jgi:predicted nucleic-acid-binding Zn-ribbon protein